MTSRFMKNKKVMVFGVFDLLHPGHIYFLKKARELGDYLLVSVPCDANVLKYKKVLPIIPEKERVKMIRASGLADKVVIAYDQFPWTTIKKEKPSIVVLGHDQNPYLAKSDKKLQKLLKIKVVRLGTFRRSKHKTALLKIFSGKVYKHLGRGKTLGFPTANIKVLGSVPEGIFAAKTKVGGKVYKALVFVGAAKTFSENKRQAEVYLLDFFGDLYSKVIEVELLRKLRNNLKFKSTKVLVEQMKDDEKKARKYFKLHH